jgi:hypothetical protein
MNMNMKQSAEASLLNELATMNAEHDDQDAKVTSFLDKRGDLDDKQLVNDIINLLKSQQYGTFLVRYLSSAKTFRAIVKCISTSTQYGGMTIIHAVVRYKPPLAIVALTFARSFHLPRTASANKGSAKGSAESSQEEKNNNWLKRQLPANAT